MSWEQQLLKINDVILEIRSAKAQLRHNSPYVKASDLASQLYCEMKVEQKYIHGEIEKEEKEIGSKLHEELIPLKSATLDTIIKALKRNEFTFASLCLLGKFKSVPIVGVPDAVVFFASKPLYLMELKTTRGRPNIWPGSWLQAQVYAYLLDKMAFDCSNLNVVVASISQQTEIDKPKFHRQLFRAIIEDNTNYFMNKWSCKVRLEPYNRDFVENKIEWALDYWLMVRDPIPTSKSSKCRNCEYAGPCPSSHLTSSIS